MKLREAAALAVKNRDAKTAGQVAMTCRLRCGMNYRQTYEWVNGIEPIDSRDWEWLLYESEDADA